MMEENLSNKIATERRKVNTEINDERVEAHCHTSINKIEQGIKEFLKKESKLFDLMATENISMDDFWHRRNKLLGKDLI